MLTGLYPSAHGLTENDGRFGGRAELDDGDWLFTHDFAEVGYRCGWVGKWHLSQKQSAADFGFEGFSEPGYGYPYGCEAYRAYLAKARLPPPAMTVELPGESGIPKETRLNFADLPDWPDFEAGSGLLDGPAEQHEAFFVADLACQWLAAAGDRPFFLRVDPWGPHPPYLVAQPFQDSMAKLGDCRSPNFSHDLNGRPEHHRAYRDSWKPLGLEDGGWQLLAQRSLEQAALVETAMLGVINTLENLGLAEDTLVIMTADHGDAVGSNGGVANKGGLLVEETIRIPLIMRGPGIAKGQVCSQVVTNLDLAPTLLSVAGIEAHADLQGRSLAPILAGRGDTARKGAMLQHYGLHHPVLQRAWREERWS